MKFIDFPQANKTFTGPLGMADKNILPVRAFNNGQTTVLCMQLTEKDFEIARANDNCLWLSFEAGPSMPPVRLSIDTPFSKSQHYQHSFRFVLTKETNGVKQVADKVWIWNGIDEDIPTQALINDQVYDLELDVNTIFEPSKVMTVNAYMFAGINEEQQAIHDCKIGCIKILKAGDIKVFSTNK